jgi:hypothetical protein
MTTKKKVAWVGVAGLVVWYYAVVGGPKVMTPPVSHAKAVERLLVKKKKPAHQKTLREFLRVMGAVESDNIHTAVNKFGMMGKYQFHPQTIRVLGFKVSNEDFLADPKLQDKVMLAYMRANRDELRGVIRKFNGKMVRGVYITESGILAGAHLTGSRGVLAFFYPERYTGNLKDANGTSISKYMRKFSGYSLSGL